ncbi:hypothetical protein EV421DRAFT_14227 [Armillaria borealis]|uniref:Uncharacterized protein n=1 Tax=Armillaria borealis TaxID=47425 RepID=A0AA39N2V8_9AGAR|nr:hypothetical protein EV421DRAFT_14227 [Armillaria borealis]
MTRVVNLSKSLITGCQVFFKMLGFLRVPPVLPVRFLGALVGLGIRGLDQGIYGMYSRGAFCGHGRYAEPDVLASLGCCRHALTQAQLLSLVLTQLAWLQISIGSAADSSLMVSLSFPVTTAAMLSVVSTRAHKAQLYPTKSGGLQLRRRSFGGSLHGRTQQAFCIHSKDIRRNSLSLNPSVCVNIIFQHAHLRVTSRLGRHEHLAHWQIILVPTFTRLM